MPSTTHTYDLRSCKETEKECVALQENVDSDKNYNSSILGNIKIVLCGKTCRNCGLDFVLCECDTCKICGENIDQCECELCECGDLVDECEDCSTFCQHCGDEKYDCECDADMGD